MEKREILYEKIYSKTAAAADPILLGITLLSFALMHSASADAVDVLEANRGGVLSEEAKAKAKRSLDWTNRFL